MAEGNYPFPSTYITYSLLPGHPTPLPAWPMRVACEQGLNHDFGIKLEGNVSNVVRGAAVAIAFAAALDLPRSVGGLC